MAELCLTRHGTSWQGLYRGLKLKTAGTDWDVQVCQVSADDLERQHGGPMILSVGLAANARVSSDFTREFGWVPGVNHSVVLETCQPGGHGDRRRPLARDVARALGRARRCACCFRGTMLRLVPRSAVGRTR